MPASASQNGDLRFRAVIDTQEFDKSIDQLKIKVDSVEASARRTKDPLRLIEYNKQSEQLSAQIERMKNVGRTGFDELGNKIKSNTNLAGKLWSGLRTVANVLPGVGIAGLLAFAIEPIANFISQLDIFKKKTDEAAEARKRLADVSLKGEQNAQAELTTLRTLYKITQDTTISLEKRKDAVNQLQKDYPKYLGNISDEAILAGKAEGAYNKLTSAILATARARASQDAITENARRQLEIERELAELQERQIKNQNKLNKAREIQAYADANPTVTSAGASTGNITTATQVYKAGAAVEENIKNQNKLTKEYNRLQAESERLAKNINIEVKKGADLTEDEKKKIKDNSKQIANERERLLKQIDAINKEYNRKALTEDERALQEVRDRFSKIRAEVVKFNKENPGLKLPLQKLNDTEKKALADLTYRQETERLKIALEEQKSLYSDFEDYRETFGEEKAKDRYKNELDTAKSYLQKIQDEINKITSVPASKLTPKETERLKFLQEERKEEVKVQEQSYKTLLSGLQNYEQERNNRIEKYKREREKLIAGGDIIAIEELDKQYKEDIDNLDDANNQKLESFKRLFEGVDDISIQSAREVVELAQAKLKELVASGRISKEMAKEVEKLLKTTTANIDKRLPAALTNLSGQINSMASAVALVDKNFAEILGTVGNVIGGVANLKNSILDIQKAQQAKKEGGGLESILGIASGAAGAIGAAVSITSAVFKGFNSVFDKTAQREAERQETQQKNLDRTKLAIEGITRAIEQQDKAIQRALGVDRIVAYRNQIKLVGTDIQKTINELNKLSFKKFNGIRNTDFDINLANLGDIIGGDDGRGNRPDPAAIKMETIQQVLEANKTSINKLYDSIQEGLIKETSNGTIEQLRLLLSTYEELEGQLEEYLNRLKEVVTGTSFDSIVDSIAQGFREGKRSAEEFAENFEDLMRTAIIQSLKFKALEKPLAAFYDQFAAYSESNGELTEQEITALQQLYDTIITNASKEFDRLKQISGVDFANEAEEEALKGVIKSLTTEQGDVLIGRTFAIQVGVEKGNTLRTEANQLLSKQTEICMDSFRQLEMIEFNTRTTQERLAQTNNRIAESIMYLASIDTTLKTTNASLRGNGYTG